MKESALVRKIFKYAESLGAFVYKNHGSVFSQIGVPDIAISLRKKSILVEVKRPGGKISKAQLVMMSKINDNAYTIITDNFEEFKEFIDTINGKS